MPNRIFILSGPSGAGEDSIIQELTKEFELERVVTTTTRPMRPGESEGQPYYFVTPAKFEAKIAAQELAEYAQEYNGHYYGVTKTELNRVQQSGKVAIWKIEYKGVQFVKQHWPEIPAIFLMADNLEVLEQRIRQRDHVTEEFVAQRMAYTKEWLKHTDIYDYHVTNRQGHLNEAVREVAKIIRQHLNA